MQPKENPLIVFRCRDKDCTERSWPRRDHGGGSAINAGLSTKGKGPAVHIKEADRAVEEIKKGG